MPVTAPTSSAMVTTRIARLILTFQLVKIVGTIAGSISFTKNCKVVGRNERIIWRSSRGTERMASSVSTRKTGPQTTTSTNPMRNSTPGNHSTANKIQETTGTAIRMRIIGCRYLSSVSDRYIAIASMMPSTNETISAAMTRASVTATSRGVMVVIAFAIRSRLGIANGGIPSAGARCDRTSQTSAKTVRRRRVCRGKISTGTDSRCSVLILRLGLSNSGRVDNLLVRHFFVEAGLDRTLHHIGDGLACCRIPRRFDDHLQPLALDRGGENSRRQLERFVGDLVAGRRVLGPDLRTILQRRDQHLRCLRVLRDRVGAHGGHDLPAVTAGDLLPALRAVEDDAPIRV